jgi:superoxide reductase
MKFYKVSNKIVEAINGDVELEEVKIRSVDASVEKHIPQVVIDDNKVIVTVGSVEHPMVDNHYIEFIEIETKNGIQRKNLKPGDQPKAVFVLENDEFINAYAYCNLHGMWDGKK